MHEMPQKLKLTVLDQSPVHPAETQPELANAGMMSIQLAKACDSLGYYRYWVAEHHNTLQFAGPCPEILIASIASVTSNLRVGSGGVMLSHYSPYKVAEVFNMLNALFPGRIDLGIGRAPGGDSLASSALAWPAQALNASSYAAQASTLKDFLTHQIPEQHAWSSLKISPLLDTSPQMWMLGSSGGSAQLAGQLGMNLALARFIAPEHCHPDIFDSYLRAWEEAGHEGRPRRMLAIAAFCAETQHEAELLASTAVYRKMMMQSGQMDDLLSPAQVQDQRKRFTALQEAEYLNILNSYTVGTADSCQSEIDRLAKSFAVDEVAIVSVTYSFADRLNSYRLLIS